MNQTDDTEAASASDSKNCSNCGILKKKSELNSVLKLKSKKLSVDSALNFIFEEPFVNVKNGGGGGSGGGGRGWSSVEFCAKCLKSLTQLHKTLLDFAALINLEFEVGQRLLEIRPLLETAENGNVEKIEKERDDVGEEGLAQVKVEMDLGDTNDNEWQLESFLDSSPPAPTSPSVTKEEENNNEQPSDSGSEGSDGGGHLGQFEGGGCDADDDDEELEESSDSEFDAEEESDSEVDESESEFALKPVQQNNSVAEASSSSGSGGISSLNCTICDKTFAQKNSLVRHMKAHSQGEVFNCSSCPKSFNRNDSLRDHIRRVHKGEELPSASGSSSAKKRSKEDSGKICQFCDQAFFDRSTLRRHTKRMHGPNSTAKDTTKSKSTAKRRKKEKEGETPLDQSGDECIGVSDDEDSRGQVMCSPCGRGFHDRSTLKRHFKRVHPALNVMDYLPPLKKREKSKIKKRRKKKTRKENKLRSPQTCSMCSLTICDFWTLEKHLRRFHHVRSDLDVDSIPDDVYYDCPEPNCGKFFSFKRSLEDHLIKHGLREKYKCTEFECTQEFLNNKALKYHIRVDHLGEEPEIHSCPVEGCGRTANKKYYITDHLRTVHPEFIIEKTTSNRMSLVQCEVCGKEMKFWRIKAHMMSHTDEKPELCELCGLRLRNKSTLNAHMRDVHLERDLRYECVQCTSTFKRQNDLKRHIEAIHEYHGPFICEQCGKRFKYQRGLEVHMNTHNRVDLVTCTECSRTFSTPYNLKVHVLTVHQKVAVRKKRGSETVSGATVRRRRSRHSDSDPNQREEDSDASYNCNANWMPSYLKP